MPQVNLPNGTQLNFPDGMSEDAMRSAIHTNFPEYAPKAAASNAGGIINSKMEAEQPASSDPMGSGFGETMAVAEPAPASSGSALGNELGNLRDSFFSGVDSSRASLKTVNVAAQFNLLQQTKDKLAKLEGNGEGNSPEAAGLRKTVDHYANRLPLSIGGMTEAQADAKRGSEMTTKPAVEAMGKAKTFGEAWNIFKENPYDVIAGVASQSLAGTIPALITGAVMGPVAGALAMGASSAATEAGSSLGDFAGDHGVDMTNPKAVEAFFSNRQNLADAMAYAGKRAGIIGTLDAASGGLAGKTIAPAMKSQIARQAVNLPAQMTVQAALGAGGEAGGQLATKGKIDQPGQVLMEAVGELGGAPLEIAAFGREARLAAREQLLADKSPLPPAPADLIANISKETTVDGAIAAMNKAVGIIGNSMQEQAPIRQAGVLNELAPHADDVAGTEQRIADLQAADAAIQQSQVSPGEQRAQSLKGDLKSIDELLNDTGESKAAPSVEASVNQAPAAPASVVAPELSGAPLEHAADQRLTPVSKRQAVEESVQDKSNREWAENYQAVTGDIAGATEKNIIRAIGFASKQVSGYQPRAFDGDQGAKSMIDSLKREMNGLQQELNRRKPADVQGQKQAPAQEIPAQAAPENVAANPTKDLADARAGLAVLERTRKMTRSGKRADIDSQIERAKAAIDEMESAADTTPAADIRLGRDNVPLHRGGKPYKTNRDAKKAQTTQPVMRVMRVEGGFALAQKTEKQLAAEVAGARRLRNPRTGLPGQAIAAHEFIAGKGMLSPNERADMGIEGNVRIGNRFLFASEGNGLTMAQATEYLYEEGYIQEEDEQAARNLIKRSLTNPQFTPEGTERMAELAAEQQRKDFDAEQEAIAVHQELEDNQFADAADAYEAAMLNEPADVKQSDMSREDAFLAMGFTEQEYQNAITDESRGPQSSSKGSPGPAEVAAGPGAQSDSGRESAPGSDSRSGSEAGLVAPSRQDILNQQQPVTFSVKPEFGKNTLAGNSQFEQAREHAQTLQPGKYSLVTIDRSGLYLNSPSEQTLYGAWVSNGDGTAQYVSRAFPQSRQTLDVEAVNALYQAAIASKQDIKAKFEAATAERLTAIEKQKLRIGVEWRGAQAYVQGKIGMTTFSRSKITAINANGYLTVQSVLPGSNKSYIFTVDPDSRLFDNYPTVSGLTAPSQQDVLNQQDRKDNANKLDDREQIRKESEAGANQFGLTQEEGRQDTTGALFDAPADPVAETKATLDANNVTGKERLDVLKDVKSGTLTVDEVKDAYPKKIEDFGEKIAGASSGSQTGDGVAVIFQEALQAGKRGARAFSDFMAGQTFFRKLDKLLQVPSYAGVQSQASNFIYADAATGKSGFNSVRSNAQALADIIKANTGTNQQFGSFDAETQRLVLSHVLALSQNDQVFKTVVQLVPVDVVNDLAARELSPESLLNDPAMVKLAIAGNLGNTVALRGYTADAFVRTVALAGAEIGSTHVGSNLERPAGNDSATTGAGNIDLGHGINDTRNDGKQKENDAGDVAMFSRTSPVFRSALRDGIDGINAKAMPGNMWADGLKGLINKGAVKADEVEWSGVTDWLKLQEGKVSKEQVLDYLDGNGVKIEETVLIDDPQATGEAKFRADLEAMSNDELVDAAEENDVDFVRITDRNRASIIDEIVRNIRDTNLDETPYGETKYGQYQLPGGENYKELLLTLPGMTGKQALARKVIFDKYAPELARLRKAEDDAIRTGGDVDVALEQHNKLAAKRDQEAAAVAGEKADYKSSHWEQPNILAHIRFNERTDATGARVLFIEEVQSDFGQAIKKKGAAGTVEAALKANGMTRAEFDALPQEDQAFAINETRNMGLPPSAPFVGRTDAWVGLALKRMISYAAENGFDKVAFVNGEQSAERYDLSKQVQSISYRKNADGTFHATAMPIDGGQVVELGTNVTADKLEESVGKDIAQKIVNGEGKNAGGDLTTLSGVDLKVGGSGMIAFYDRIVPAVAKDVLRKLGGGQMGMVDISQDHDAGANETKDWNDSAARSTLKRGGEIYLTQFGIGEDLVKNEAALDEWIADNGKPTGYILGDKQGRSAQPGFDITQAMRDKAAAGLPMFGRVAASAGAQAQANGVVQKQVDSIKASWKNAPQIVVAFDMQDPKIPQRIRDEDLKQRSGGAVGTPEGFYYKGVVYLMSSQLKTINDTVRVLFHESLGHAGLRGNFGKALNPILQQIILSRPDEIAAKIKEYGLRGVNQIDRMTAAEEVLAELAQTRPELGIVKRAIAAIRTWLRANVPGFKNLTLTDAEIINNYILPARNWVERGQQANESSMVPAFARDQKSLAETLEPATVKQVGDKWAAVRYEGTGREQHFSYHATEQQAKDAAAASDSKIRLEANTRAGKFAGWSVSENSTESFRSTSIGGVNAVDTGRAVRQTLDARIRAVKSTAEGRVLQQIPSREGFCFKCAADAAMQNIGDFVIGVSPSVDGPLWHAVVMRDDMVYDPTFGKWFAPGVYEKLGFKETMRLTPAQVKDFSRQSGGKSPDARNQGLGDKPGDAPMLSRSTPASTEQDPTEERKAYTGPGANMMRGAREFGDVLYRDLMMKVAPMTAGEQKPRAAAQTFANDVRVARYQWEKMTAMLKDKLDPEQRKAMWEAAEEENAERIQQRDDENYVRPEGTGIDALPENQRKIMQTLNAYGNQLWKHAQAAGLVQGDGVPFWTPRMAVMIGDDGDFAKPGMEGKKTASDGSGRNVFTTAPSAKHRKYDTLAESEKALKAKLGDSAAYVRDILTMPLAISRFEQAIAGRELINQVKEIGLATGKQLVSTIGGPNFFTLDHPAFTNWRPRMMPDASGKVVPVLDENGEIVMDRQPLFIDKSFEGPLKAVMSTRDGTIYSGYMLLKSKAMSMIMASPLTHNMVIYGRALAYNPAKVGSGYLYWKGHIMAKDSELMTKLIGAGMVPIGANRNSMMDITDVARGIGREGGWGDSNESWVSLSLQKLGNALKDGVGDTLKSKADAMGDFVHHTLLWKQVGAIQVGIANDMLQHLMAKGYSEKAALTLAAHFSNRYAGAVASENMSEIARKAANVLLFSRSFNMGNLGAMKDVLFGMPSGLKAKLMEEVGELEGNRALTYAKRKAISSILVEVGFAVIALSLVASAVDRWKKDKDLDEIEEGYLRRLRGIIGDIKEHPFNPKSYNPYKISPTWDNEPGRQDKINMGPQESGRYEYMRLPTGKVVEDMIGWATEFGATFSKKMSPMAKAVWQDLENDKGFGVPVADPDSTVWEKAYDMASHVVKAQLPWDSIKNVYDLTQGVASDLDKDKMIGFLTGFSYSQGHPQGPEAGVASKVEERIKASKMYAMEEIKNLIKYGQEDAARDRLEAIGLTPLEINHIMNTITDPKANMSRAQNKKFNQHSTDEEKARLDGVAQ